MSLQRPAFLISDQDVCLTPDGVRGPSYQTPPFIDIGEENSSTVQNQQHKQIIMSLVRTNLVSVDSMLEITENILHLDATVVCNDGESGPTRSVNMHRMIN